MPELPEDLSTCSLEDVMISHAENRAWNKELRMRNTDLVNSRLAQRIGHDEYAIHRKVGVADALECKRRATVLANEITSRTRH